MAPAHAHAHALPPSPNPAALGEHAASASRSSHRTSAPPSSRAARTVLSLLGKLQHGTLDLHAPWGSRLFRHPLAAPGAPPPELRASMHLHDEAVFGQVLKSGDIGLAESYVEGRWTTPDLKRLLELFMRNRESLQRAVYGSPLGMLVHRLTHWARRNSRRGSRRNIEAHYDLGNEFYAAWLDPTMNYSSAWWDGDFSLPLQQAQERKVQRALDEARVGAGDTLLEIGCGWGAVAQAAVERGALVVGVTLSHEQLAYARQRLQGIERPHQVDLRLQDYRDLAAEVARRGRRYDGIVSIEMFEAVGRTYWPGYFEALAGCLEPGGRACVQVIVIRDDLFARYLRSTDFIQQYVFPGGLLPSAEVFRAEAVKGGLEVVRELAFGADYARTLALWRASFHAERRRIEALGYDERFMRLWDFYLAYCEAAFATRQTDVVQFTLRHKAGHAGR